MPVEIASTIPSETLLPRFLEKSGERDFEQDETCENCKNNKNFWLHDLCPPKAG